MIGQFAHSAEIHLVKAVGADGGDEGRRFLVAHVVHRPHVKGDRLTAQQVRLVEHGFVLGDLVCQFVGVFGQELSWGVGGKGRDPVLVTQIHGLLQLAFGAGKDAAVVVEMLKSNLAKAQQIAAQILREDVDTKRKGLHRGSLRVKRVSATLSGA